MKTINPTTLFQQLKDTIPEYYKEHISEATDGEGNTCWNCGIGTPSHLVTIMDGAKNKFQIIICEDCLKFFKKRGRIKILKHEKITIQP